MKDKFNYKFTLPSQRKAKRERLILNAVFAIGITAFILWLFCVALVITGTI